MQPASRVDPDRSEASEGQHTDVNLFQTASLDICEGS